MSRAAILPLGLDRRTSFRGRGKGRGLRPRPIFPTLPVVSQHSQIITLEVPDDFPLAPLEQFHYAVQPRHERENEKWGHWARACAALHYRFLACAEADDVFRSSLSAVGPGPPPPERARQEIALFAFFSSGLSALECLGYGLYFVAAIVDPAAFTRPPHKIWFGDVANAYQERFESDSIRRGASPRERKHRARELAARSQRSDAPRSARAPPHPRRTIGLA